MTASAAATIATTLVSHAPLCRVETSLPSAHAVRNLPTHHAVISLSVVIASVASHHAVTVQPSHHVATDLLSHRGVTRHAAIVLSVAIVTATLHRAVTNPLSHRVAISHSVASAHATTILTRAHAPIVHPLTVPPMQVSQRGQVASSHHVRVHLVAKHSHLVAIAPLVQAHHVLALHVPRQVRDAALTLTAVAVKVTP